MVDELELEADVVVVQNTTGFLLKEEAEVGRVELLVGFELVELVELVEGEELVAQNKTGL